MDHQGSPAAPPDRGGDDGGEVGAGLVGEWEARSGQPITGRDWLFRTFLDRDKRLTAGYLGHLVAATRDRAGLPDIVLHQFRHTVATYLVAQGQILKAQRRLGHRDASTTLRNYAHALPLDDEDAADAIDDLLADQD